MFHKMTKRLLILLVLLTAEVSAHAKSFIKADDQRLAYVGRVSFAHKGTAAWTYPGIQIHAVFEGTSVAMKTNPGSGYYMIEIDDMQPFKVESATTDSVVQIAHGLKDGSHRLTITYAIEGLLKHPVFYGIILDEGKSLGERPILPERKIEFIGNSITCGYGIEGNGSEQKFSYSQQNLYYTYEARTARELNAQWQVVARSGIGIYRNNNGNPQGDRGVMPDCYPYTFFGQSGERWDFSRYQPQVVCVNLGTNDTTGPRYDTKLLANAFKRFVQQLRNRYPKAKIVLLTGTMINGQRLANLQQAQQEAIDYAAALGDHEVYRFDFTPADGSLGYGTHKHPSMRQHEQMAKELTPFLRQLMEWDN